jgi:hypothetical protein
MAALALLLLAACATADYVPDTGWEDEGWAADFYEDWFGKQLRAANERPLARRDDLGQYAARLRMLVLPSFDPAFVFRIDQDASGLMTIVFTRLDGAGGYEPGRISETWKRVLSHEEAEAVSVSIKAAQLELVPLEDDPNMDGTIAVCADGTQFVFERLTPGRREFVTRHECELDEYPRLAELSKKIIEIASRP